MEGKGTLTLDLVDVYGDHLKDRFDVFMKHTVLAFDEYSFSERE